MFSKLLAELGLFKFVRCRLFGSTVSSDSLEARKSWNCFVKLWSSESCSESTDLDRVNVSGSVSVLGGNSNSKFFSENVTLGFCVGISGFRGGGGSGILEVFDAWMSRLKDSLTIKIVHIKALYLIDHHFSLDGYAWSIKNFFHFVFKDRCK